MRRALPILLVGALVSCGPRPTESIPACPPGGTQATWSNHAEPFLGVWCTGCHHQALPIEDRQGAPEGADYDSYEGAHTWAIEIYQRAVVTDSMPPVGGPSAEGRALLGEWIACGLPGGRAEPKEPCQGERSVLPGDLVVHSAADLDTFCARYDAVGGQLVVEGTGSVGLGCLCEVGGGVTVSGASGLTSASFPNLEQIGGDLSVQDNPTLAAVDFSAVEGVGGEVRVSGNPALRELWLSRLFTTAGGLEVRDNAGLQSLGLERVVSVGGDYAIADNPSLRTLFGDAYPLLDVGGDLTVSGNPQLTGFYGFIELLSVGGSVVLADNDSFESFFGFTALESVGGSVEIRENARLGLIDGFDHLERAPGGLVVRDNPVMRYIDGFRVLTRLEGAGLELVDLPQLDSAGGLDALRAVASVTVSRTGLTQLADLYGLDAIDGDLVVTDNPALPSSQVDNLVIAVGAQNIGGYVTNSGNAP